MRSKPRILAAVAATALALTASGCGGSQPTPLANDFPAGSTMHELAASGRITVGASPNQPGLAELNLQKQWEGFNMDLTIHLVKGLGMDADDIEWVNTTAANRIPFIKQGKIDIFATALAMTPEREKTIAISGPYMGATPQLLVRKGDAAGLNKLEDVKNGTKICVLQGSQGQPRVAKDIPQAEIVEFNVLTNCIRALEQGTVDAVDSTAPLLAGFVVKKPEAFELAPMTYGEGEHWGIGMMKGRADLCRFFNEGMERAFADGTITALWEKHMGKSGLASPKPPKKMTGC